MKHKHAEIIKAWADGAEIECRHHSDTRWHCTPNPSWSLGFHYRVKPVEKSYGQILAESNDNKWQTMSSYAKENFERRAQLVIIEYQKRNA